MVPELLTQLIKSFVDNVVTPKIKKFAEECNIEYKELLVPKGAQFEEYLNRTYVKYSTINPLVFHNSQCELKKIYVAQSLVKDSYSGLKETTKIDQLPISLIKNYKKILIEDTAGMGKSTIMKRMFIDLIDRGLNDVGIPIYIELNRLKKDHSIIMEIQKELNSLSKEFDSKMLRRFIENGGFIFFLDGYDEISISDRIEVTQNIHEFIDRAGNNNYFILTSRPEDSLTSFGLFQSFKIKRITREEAFELLTKYDESEEKELSGKLIGLLETGKYKAIDEYLENPFLVTLLYTAFDYKHIIPLKKHQFYRQVYDAFFDSFDLSKNIERQKYSGLDTDGFYRVLSYVGYECLVRIGVQFDTDTIISSIDRARQYFKYLEFGSKLFLKDLIETVPLFAQDGLEYKWAHKSLMEYFAAQFIAQYANAYDNQKKDEILSAIYNSENLSKFFNLLDLYYDIDYQGFLKNIKLPFLKEYMTYHDSVFPTKTEIKRDLIEARIGLLFYFYKVGITREVYYKYYYEQTNGIAQYSSLGSKLEPKYKIIQETVDDFFVMGAILSSEKISVISKLIYNKQQNLFKRYLPNTRSVKNDDICKYKQVYEIDVLMGDDCDGIFVFINNLLNHLLNTYNLLDSKANRSIYLSYEVVSEEIEMSNRKQPDLFAIM